MCAGGDLAEALRQVDAATFIDPVVPVESERAAGAFVKKGMRSLLMWYVGWVTHQMSQSASAMSRALHIVDDRLKELERSVEAQKASGGGVVEFAALASVPRAGGSSRRLAALAKAPGRVLHAACGDGWLVRRLGAAGIDAYGVDPRSALVDRAELGVLDLRGEDVADHLRAVAASALGGVVLSGVVEGLAGGERTQLLADVASRLAPGGTLVVHSVTRATWESVGRAVEADLAPGHPLRAETWCELLGAGAATRPRRWPGREGVTSWSRRCGPTSPPSAASASTPVR